MSKHSSVHSRLRDIIEDKPGSPYLEASDSGTDLGSFPNPNRGFKAIVGAAVLGTTLAAYSFFNRNESFSIRPVQGPVTVDWNEGEPALLRLKSPGETSLTVDIIKNERPNEMIFDGTEMEIVQSETFVFDKKPDQERVMILDTQKMPEFATIRFSYQGKHSTQAEALSFNYYSKIIREAASEK